jgi:hypothetical protein
MAAVHYYEYPARGWPVSQRPAGIARAAGLLHATARRQENRRARPKVGLAHHGGEKALIEFAREWGACANIETL